MKRREFMAGALPAAWVAATALRAVHADAADAADAPLSVTPLAERLWLIGGAGGNVTEFQNSEGVLLVDGGAAAHTQRLLAEVRRHKSLKGWKTKTPVHVTVKGEPGALAILKLAQQDLSAAITASKFDMQEAQALDVIVEAGELVEGAEPRA